MCCFQFTRPLQVSGSIKQLVVCREIGIVSYPEHRALAGPAEIVQEVTVMTRSRQLLSLSEAAGVSMH